jgi:hypothetical protein
VLFNPYHFTKVVRPRAIRTHLQDPPCLPSTHRSRCQVSRGCNCGIIPHKAPHTPGAFWTEHGRHSDRRGCRKAAPASALDREQPRRGRSQRRLTRFAARTGTLGHGQLTRMPRGFASRGRATKNYRARSGEAGRTTCRATATGPSLSRHHMAAGRQAH